jgi:hypothetical protein
VACSSCKDGIAAVPVAISAEVNGQRIMITAATSTTAANAGIVRRIMASLRFQAPELVFGAADMVQGKVTMQPAEARTLFVGTTLEPHAAFRESS